MTVVVPVLIMEPQPGHRPSETVLSVTLKCLDHLYTYTKEPFNLLIIDHGSIPEVHETIKALDPPNLTYVRHEDRARGMVDAINEAWKTTTSPLLAFMHNDLYVMTSGWDHQVYELSNQDPKLGIIGFGGGYGMGPDGYRYGFASNMVDANVHGVHRWAGWMPALPLDGLIMIMTRKMLDRVGGIPTEYKIHHFYDLEMSAASAFAGFHNYVLFIRCQHVSGQTRMAPELDGTQIYNHNREIFMRRWASLLPAYVTSDFKIYPGIPERHTHDAHYFPQRAPPWHLATSKI